MSILKDLKSFRPHIRLLVLSKTPIETAKDFHVASINRASPIRIYRAMKIQGLHIWRRKPVAGQYQYKIAHVLPQHGMACKS